MTPERRERGRWTGLEGRKGIERRRGCAHPRREAEAERLRAEGAHRDGGLGSLLPCLG